MPPMRRIAIALATAVLPVHAVALSPGENEAIESAARETMPEFIEFLKIPNIATESAADMRKNADWLVAAFKRHGFGARLLEDGETPMVYAEWPGTSPSGKTILFYAHMDGQPVFPREWDQADPFVPVLKQKGPDGTWTPIAIENMLGGEPIDPEWRVFGRSAADDKAPIVMLLAAMDALQAAGKMPAINVKIIIDPREEIGSPTLKDVVARNIELLQSDAIVILDGPMHATNRPTIVYGHRGATGFQLTVFGARTELHSGHFGNYVPDPSVGLAKLIAAMKDDQGRVLIPGFYDGVDLSPQVKAALTAVPDDEPAMRARLGIAENEHVGDSYQEAMNYPTLNVLAMISGQPESRRSIIPAFATAMFGSRTVPGTPPGRQIELVRKWVQDQGYHLVPGEPTEEDRKTYPKLAFMTGGWGGGAMVTPLDAPVGMWAERALRNAFGQDPVRIPIMGGSIPTEPLIEGLKVPILLIPLVNADNNQHAANENLRLGNYEAGVRSLYALFTEEYGDP